MLSNRFRIILVVVALVNAGLGALWILSTGGEQRGRCVHVQNPVTRWENVTKQDCLDLCVERSSAAYECYWKGERIRG